MDAGCPRRWRARRGGCRGLSRAPPRRTFRSSVLDAGSATARGAADIARRGGLRRARDAGGLARGVPRCASPGDGAPGGSCTRARGCGSADGPGAATMARSQSLANLRVARDVGAAAMSASFPESVSAARQPLRSTGYLAALSVMWGALSFHWTIVGNNVVPTRVLGFATDDTKGTV